MSRFKKLSHVIYYHRYHLVWTPKYRYRILEGLVKEGAEQKIRQVCEWKRMEIIELNVQVDHVHLILDVPPRISVSQAMGFLKGKTAIYLFKNFPNLKKKPYWGNHFWSRGYCSSTLGLDEEKIKKYVKYQEKQERLIEGQQQSFDF